MRKQELNHDTGNVLIILSLVALLTVLSGYTQPAQPPTKAGAHIHSS